MNWGDLFGWTQKLPETAYLLWFSGLGAYILFCKLNHEKTPVIDFITVLIPPLRNSPWRRPARAVGFTVVGAFAAWAITQPTNVQQAIAAGLGWTGLMSGLGRPDRGQPASAGDEDPEEEEE